MYMFHKRQKLIFVSRTVQIYKKKKIDDDDEQGDGGVGVGGDADDETDGNYTSHYQLT